METIANLSDANQAFDILSCLKYEQDNNCNDNAIKFNAIGLAMLACHQNVPERLAEMGLMYLEAIAEDLAGPAEVFDRLRDMSVGVINRPKLASLPF